MKFLLRMTVRAETEELLKDASQEALVDALTEVAQRRGDGSDSWAADELEVEWQTRTPLEGE